MDLTSLSRGNFIIHVILLKPVWPPHLFHNLQDGYRRHLGYEKTNEEQGNGVYSREEPINVIFQIPYQKKNNDQSHERRHSRVQDRTQ